MLGAPLRHLRKRGSVDGVTQKAVTQSSSSRKTSVPWEVDKPHSQPYFTFDTAKCEWVSKTASPAAAATKQTSASGITRLALLVWNIDFMLPYAEARMAAGLATLRGLVNQLPPTTAAIIFLQECVLSDLNAIAAATWVRDRFHLSDLDHQNWGSGHYGTTTLVDRRLQPAAVFRVHYEKTRMERDALFTDVMLPPAGAGAGGRSRGAPSRLLRLCNTHLESLALEPPYRPPQARVFAGYLHEKGVTGALAGGDFNAIQDFDRSLHASNGLKDAYLELGGREDSEEGYTWGQQAATFLRERFGLARMDKVYFCGGLELKSFERFGADVQLEDPEQGRGLVGLGFEKPWITDHLGIKAEFEITE